MAESAYVVLIYSPWPSLYITVAGALDTQLPTEIPYFTAIPVFHRTDNCPRCGITCLLVSNFM